MLRVETQEQRLEAADHVAQDFEAGAVDGEAQALAGDARVGVEKDQDGVRRADLEDRRQDRFGQRQPDDLGAQGGDLYGRSPQPRRTVVRMSGLPATSFMRPKASADTDTSQNPVCRPAYRKAPSTSDWSRPCANRHA